jgi:uncharacterized protein (DUF2062 family)
MVAARAAIIMSPLTMVFIVAVVVSVGSVTG